MSLRSAKEVIGLSHGIPSLPRASWLYSISTRASGWSPGPAGPGSSMQQCAWTEVLVGDAGGYEIDEEGRWDVDEGHKLQNPCRVCQSSRDQGVAAPVEYYPRLGAKLLIGHLE